MSGVNHWVFDSKIDMLKKSKEISKIKLTLTTNCNANCSYCFVEKTKERMSPEVARKSVDLLIESTGKEKLLSLYGGEPFLEFSLIENIVIYAREREKKFKKNLIISICSNLLLLDDHKLAFIKKYHLKVTVSIVGKGLDHNKFRGAKGLIGSYDRVIGNMAKLAAVLPRADIGISFVVLPSLSSKIEDYFFHILSLKLSNNINFEIIQEFDRWKDEDCKKFVSAFQSILLKVVTKIGENDFIFINPISWELGRRKLTETYGVSCQVKYNIEVYPSGDMAFSPFLLNGDDAEKKHFSIGNIKTGLNENFSNCRLDPNSEKCEKCESNYYGNYSRTDDASFVVESYGKLSLEVAKKIELLSKRNSYFREYVRYAKKNLCF